MRRTLFVTAEKLRRLIPIGKRKIIAGIAAGFEWQALGSASPPDVAAGGGEDDLILASAAERGEPLSRMGEGQVRDRRQTSRP